MYKGSLYTVGLYFDQWKKATQAKPLIAVDSNVSGTIESQATTSGVEVLYFSLPTNSSISPAPLQEENNFSFPIKNVDFFGIADYSAWSILDDIFSSANFGQVKSLLDEKGIKRAGDLLFCDLLQITAILNCLKDVPKKIFLSLLLFQIASDPLSAKHSSELNCFFQ